MSNSSRIRFIRYVAAPVLTTITLLVVGCSGAPIKQAPAPTASSPPVAATANGSVTAMMTAPAAVTAPAPASAPAPVMAAHVHRRHHKRRVRTEVAQAAATTVPAAPVETPKVADTPPAAPTPAPLPVETAPAACTGGFFACSHGIYWVIGGIIVAIIALFLLVGAIRKPKSN